MLVEHFRRVARDRPDDILLWAPHEGRGLRAGEILNEAHALGVALRRAGLTRGDVVLSVLGNQPAFVTLTLACLSEGWPLLATDRATPRAEFQALARRWHAAALVLAELPADQPDNVRAVNDMPAGLWAGIVTPKPEGGRYGDAVLLKLTSGSTGTPKLTLTAERHLVADVRHITQGMDIGPRTRQLGVIPLSHSYGFSNLLLPLLWQGSPLLLQPGFVPAQVAANATSFGAETWAGVPFMFEHVARHVAAPFPPTIRTVISAGARLPFDVVEDFHRRTGRKVRSFYGSSETGGICYDETEVLSPDVPVGRPLGDTHVSLREDPDAPWGSGRVVVHGPGVIDGYADGEDADAFDDGGFVTGDFGRLTPDGQLVLTGRAASVVNIAGRKVLPTEVETAMRTVPDVLDVVVVGLPDDRRGQALGACFVASRRIVPVAMRAALTSRLASYKLPRVIVQVDALPLTVRGKPDRVAIFTLLEQARQAS